MEITCLRSNVENNLIDNEASNLDEQYVRQEIFYPLWYVDVEICLHFFSFRIRKSMMRVGVDGLSRDVSFICNEIDTYEIDVKPEQILPLTSEMDEEGLKASLLPYILPKVRSIFVRPSISIQSCRVIYKPLYRLSNRHQEGEVIFIDKTYGKIATFKNSEES